MTDSEYHQLADGGLEADFSRFALTLGESESLAGLSQAELQALPPMTFHCDSCSLGGINIGAVDFVTKPTDDGLEVVSLTAKTKQTLLSLAGAAAAGTPVRLVWKSMASR